MLFLSLYISEYWKARMLTILLQKSNMSFFLFTKNMRSRQCIRLGGPWRPLIRQRQFFSENLTPRILYIFSLKKWSTKYNESRLRTFSKECVSTCNSRGNGSRVPLPTYLIFTFYWFNWKLDILCCTSKKKKEKKKEYIQLDG